MSWIALALLCHPIASRAQDDGSGSARIALVPRTGYRVLDKLAHFSARNLPSVESGEPGLIASGVNDSPMVGLALDLDLPVPWLDLQLGIDRTLGAKIWTLTQAGIAPAKLEAHDMDMALWLGSMELVWTPAPASWSVRPYATGGSGFKYFSVDDAELRELGISAGDVVMHSSVHIGGGAEITVAGRPFRFEAADHISFADATPVHDLVMTVGAVIPLD